MIAALIVAFVLTLLVKSGKLGIFGTVMEVSKVSAVIEKAEEAIEVGDAERFVALFAEDFNWQGVTYSRLKEAGPGLLQSILPVSISPLPKSGFTFVIPRAIASSGTPRLIAMANEQRAFVTLYRPISGSRSFRPLQMISVPSSPRSLEPSKPGVLFGPKYSIGPRHPSAR